VHAIKLLQPFSRLNPTNLLKDMTHQLRMSNDETLKHMLPGALWQKTKEKAKILLSKENNIIANLHSHCGDALNLRFLSQNTQGKQAGKKANNAAKNFKSGNFLKYKGKTVRWQNKIDALDLATDKATEEGIQNGLRLIIVEMLASEFTAELESQDCLLHQQIKAWWKEILNAKQKPEQIYGLMEMLPWIAQQLFGKENNFAIPPHEDFYKNLIIFMGGWKPTKHIECVLEPLIFTSSRSRPVETQQIETQQNRQKRANQLHPQLGLHRNQLILKRPLEQRVNNYEPWYTSCLNYQEK